jgi:hypothetical protein
MLNGYFCLDKGEPLFECEPGVQGYSLPIKEACHFGLSTALESYGFSIPSRDKYVLSFGVYCEALPTLDSFQGENEQLTYAQKLERLGLGKELGVIINKTEHGSLAVLGCPYHYGLYDTKQKSAYYMFTDDARSLERLLVLNPLRYLVYRFPQNTAIVFLQAEGLYNKWHRWMRNSNSPLHAFNALEHKLHGPTKA